MLNFGLLITLVSALTGTYLLGIISLLYFQNRTILLRDYGLFILSLYLFSLAALLEQLIITGSNEVHWLFTGLLWLIQITAGIMYIGTSPFFFLHMFNIVVKPIIHLLLITVDIIAVVTALVFLFVPEIYFTVHILSFLMFGTLFWEILLILLKLFTLKDKILKSAVSILLIVTVFFTPLMLMDYVISIFPIFDFLKTVDNLSRPVYFLIISILSIIFTFVYFNRPGFRKNNELTVYFLEKYRITPREKEIIELVLRGDNNKAIGKTLFISPKTVENHITSIYQKMAVNNRVQLAQMIFNNSEK